MKKQSEISQLLFFSMILIGINSCNSLPNPKKDTKINGEVITQNFDWLIGRWTRINSREDQTTFETWERKGNSEFIGFSYTMQNNDTIWQESVRLINTDNNWSFNVTGIGEIEPIKFKVTTIEERKFVCENQANEFPKTIEYSFVEDELHAKITGTDIEVLFSFKKTELN